MRAAREAGNRLAALAAASVGVLVAASPGMALGQARTLPDRVPPGGLSSAWPLGIIVLLVAAMMLVGTWISHRRAGAGRPRRGG
jgi:hypothetical protein